MKKLLFNLVILLFAASLTAQNQQANQVTKPAANPDIVKIGQTVPDFTFTDETGKNVKISDLKGRVVMINFFATWCGPCNAELPVLQQEVWGKYKNNPDFRLLILGREHSQSEVDKFREDKKYEFPMYADPGRVIFSKFAGSLIPRNYIINKDGQIVYTSIGYNKEEFEKLVKFLDELMK
jgi:peroxiredoxin